MGCDQSKDAVAGGGRGLMKGSRSSMFLSSRWGSTKALRNQVQWQEDFEELKQIGEGLMSNVFEVASRDNADARYALKQMLEEVADADSIAEMKREYRALKTCRHPNILKVYKVFEPDGVEEMSLLTELCTGGSLKRLELPLSEQQVKHIVRQVLSALEYLHTAKGLAHRDLALEHILLADRETDLENCTVKLCDFGLVKSIKKGEKFKYTVGDPSYMSPEAVKCYNQGSHNSSGYTEKTDTWAVGVIAYELLSGVLPFFAEDMEQYTNKVIRGDYNFDHQPWKNGGSSSEQSQDFIHHLLQLDPRHRYSPRQALDHPWLASS